jgi:hypothetical protein
MDYLFNRGGRGCKEKSSKSWINRSIFGDTVSIKMKTKQEKTHKTTFSPLSVTTYAKKVAMYHFPQTQHLPLPLFFYLQFPIPA